MRALPPPGPSGPPRGAVPVRPAEDRAPGRLRVLLRHRPEGAAAVGVRPLSEEDLQLGETLTIARIEHDRVPRNAFLRWPGDPDDLTVPTDAFVVVLQKRRVVLTFGAAFRGPGGTLPSIDVRIDGVDLPTAQLLAGIVEQPLTAGRARIVEIERTTASGGSETVQIELQPAEAGAVGRRTVPSEGSVRQREARALLLERWWVGRIDGTRNGRLIRAGLSLVGDERPGRPVGVEQARTVLADAAPGTPLGERIRAAVRSLLDRPHGLTDLDWHRALRVLDLDTVHLQTPGAVDGLEEYGDQSSVERFLELCRRLQRIGLLD